MEIKFLALFALSQPSQYLQTLFYFYFNCSQFVVGEIDLLDQPTFSFLTMLHFYFYIVLYKKVKMHHKTLII